jgi:hypothetical protein
MAHSKLRDFTVYAWVQVLTDVTVRAASLEEAAQQANELDVTDFVTLSGDYVDGSMAVEAVYEMDARSRLRV